VGRKKLVRKAEPSSRRGIAWPRWTGFRGMTLRSWLELLVVPLALVVIGFLFSVQQDARQQRIEDQRAQAERELAEQRAQDEALQAYLDQMSALTLEKNLHHADAGDEVLTVARARTLAALGRLDPSRKTAIMQFLTEARLVQGSINEKLVMHRSGGAIFPKEIYENVPVISLGGADLSGTDLSELGGKGCSIQGTSRTMYYSCGGSSADLSGADLSSADLSGANLRGAFLDNANLFGANLSRANLSHTELTDATLQIAALRGANLSGAEGITNEELEQQAASLEGATMPNGQKYDDWLKDKKDQGKDEKNE
jgi:uncharacterized protein YjbI with pentapeptide repeats